MLDALGFDPISLDELIARTGWSAAELSARLLELELEAASPACPASGSSASSAADARRAGRRRRRRSSLPGHAARSAAV